AVLPRRLIYVVDRRVVVDHATAESERIAIALGRNDSFASDIRDRLGFRPEQMCRYRSSAAGPMIIRSRPVEAASQPIARHVNFDLLSPRFVLLVRPLTLCAHLQFSEGHIITRKSHCILPHGVPGVTG
ncbi:MAG: hypothetical protein ACREU6_02745, partial [Steroidobacteraceae bacterium]